MRSSTEAIVKRLTDLGLIEVVERHARAHHVSVAEVCGEWRTRAITAARHGAWAEIYGEGGGMSYPEIATLFGGRDHTTIMHGVKKARTTGLIALASKVRVG